MWNMEPDVRDQTADANAEHRAQQLKERAAIEAARNVTATAPLVPQAAAGELATFADVSPLVANNVAELYARLIAVATERVALYGRQLAAAYAQSAEDALRTITHLVDPETGELVPNGEQLTALVQLEMKERETLERLIVRGARLGIEKTAADALERNGTVLVSALRTFAEGCGLDWKDPSVRRRMQTALLAAREQADQTDRRDR